jgi:predicted dehydrogenase
VVFYLNVKVGIVGFGKMGMLQGALANGIDGVSLDAISEKSKFVRTAFKTVKKRVRVFNDYKKMIDECPLDGVIVTTPTFNHFEVAEYAMEKNLPIFVEKPVTKNYDEAKELADIAYRKRIVSNVGFHYRFMPSVQKGKELLAGNAIGKIDYVEASFCSSDILAESSGWRFNPEMSGGGVLIDFGIHMLDILQWLFGEVGVVNASSKKIHSKLVEDEFNAEIRFKNGLHCKFFTSWSNPLCRKPFPSIRITGAEGMICITDQTVELNIGNEKTVFSEPDMYKGAYMDIGGIAFSLQMEMFINAIRSKIDCESNIENACYVAKIVDTMYRSATQKAELSIGE